MKKKILLVDDEIDLLFFIKYRLESFGYEAIMSTTGEEALAWLEKNIPDLILLDISLPDVSGEEVCKQLKSNGKLKHIPVILYSAKASDISEEAKRVCADDCMVKPFEAQDLLAKIKKLIG